MPTPLPGPFVHSPIAFNFASASSNKIHDDQTARRFGFEGGLVPGVASYGYLAHTAVEAFGDPWLAEGSAEVQLKQPVYEGDRVRASATWIPGHEGRRVALDLRDGSGNTCAEGWATIDRGPDGEALAAPTADRYPTRPLPDMDARPPADLEVLAAGTVLGSLSIGPWSRQELAEIAERYRDPSKRYAVDAPASLLHPAHLLHEANQILVRNVLLGPWIHVASRVRHLARVDCDGRHELRGRVLDAGSRRGHEIVTLDLALFDGDQCPITAIHHTAIIRPRQVADA